MAGESVFSMATVKNFGGLLKQTFAEWGEDNGSMLAASLAYYTVFSLAPLLIIIIGVAGFIVGQQDVQGEIMSQIQAAVGGESAGLIEEMMGNVFGDSSLGVIATIIGFLTLFLAATGVVMQLQQALNIIWDVKLTEGGGILALIKNRLISFSMILGMGFLLVVSLSIGPLLTLVNGTINTFLNNSLSGEFPAWLPTAITQWLSTVDFANVSQIVNIVQILNGVLSFAIVVLLFAMIYKFLPKVKILWRDVWVGAIFTTLLFVIGRSLISWYLTSAGVGSAYGAAGSLVVVLLWVYYSSQIVLLGAEFTQVYTRKYGSYVQTAQSTLPDSSVSLATTTPTAYPLLAESKESATKPGVKHYAIAFLTLLLGIVIGKKAKSDN